MTRIDLDAIDVRIQSAIQKHGRLSKTELAEMANLSPTPCLTKLKAAGFVLGYHTDIALNLFGNFTHVWSIFRILWRLFYRLIWE